MIFIFYFNFSILVPYPLDYYCFLLHHIIGNTTTCSKFWEELHVWSPWHIGIFSFFNFKCRKGPNWWIKTCRLLGKQCVFPFSCRTWLLSNLGIDDNCLKTESSFNQNFRYEYNYYWNCLLIWKLEHLPMPSHLLVEIKIYRLRWFYLQDPASYEFDGLAFRYQVLCHICWCGEVLSAIWFLRWFCGIIMLDNWLTN